MEANLPAKLHTSRGTYAVDVTVNNVFGMMTYYDPEQREAVIFGRDATLALSKHGWVFSHFWVTDAKNSPPLWKHKLMFMRKDGKMVCEVLSGWGSRFQG